MTTIALDQSEPLYREGARIVKLTFPIAIAFAVEMAMGVTNSVMAGSLGKESLAAGGLAGNLMFIPILWAMGALAAIGAVGAQAHGASESENVSLATQQGLRMATILVVPCALLYVLAWPMLPFFEDDVFVVEQARKTLIWALPMIPLTLWYTALRNFVTAVHRPNIGTLCAAAALAVTFVGNYAFMFGHFGMPKLGVPAIGLSGSLASLAQLAIIIIYLRLHPELRAYRVLRELTNHHRAIFADLWRVGLPIALAYMFESSMFFGTTLLMTRFETSALAAHNIVMTVISSAFMIPYAISQAATVRVGFYIGEGRLAFARRAGDVAIALALLWMTLSAMVLWLAPEFLAGFFLDRANIVNRSVFDYVIIIMAIAAIFQLVDGVQVTVVGALRGLKDTKVPMMISGFGYIGIGLVSAIVFAFPLGMGPRGLWFGLALGLAVSAALLSWRWVTLSRRLVAS